MNPLKLLIDFAAGAALAFALLIVLLVGLLTRPVDRVDPNTLEVKLVTDTGPAPTRQRKLRLMVLTDTVPNPQPGGPPMIWDDMSTLLGQLGEGYQHDTIRTKDLREDPALLDSVDVLFFTCAPGGNDLRDALTKFVSRGGILYASDWRYDAVSNAFPDVVNPGARGDGAQGKVTAEVVDPGLRELIGPTIDLNFDLPAWKTAAFQGPRVSVLLQGRYQKLRSQFDKVGQPASAPLLVKFPIGKGQVIFTSFHNEKQNNETEKKLLQYLVFTMVTAGVDAQLQSTLTEGGFAPQRSNLLSTAKENPSVTKTFRNEKAGPLRLALGFRDEGARLRLQLRSPEGKTFTWEGTSTLMLEVPQASAGEWTYTITALHLPYENFPFLVTIGERR